MSTSSQYARVYKERRKSEILRALGAKCRLCGYSGRLACYNLDTGRQIPWSHLTSRGKQALLDLAPCLCLICANCQGIVAEDRSRLTGQDHHKPNRDPAPPISALDPCFARFEIDDDYVPDDLPKSRLGDTVELPAYSPGNLRKAWLERKQGR